MATANTTVPVDKIICFECDECYIKHFITIKELLDLSEKEELFYIRSAMESFYDKTLDIILREPDVNRINLNYVFNKYKELYGFKNKTELKQYRHFVYILLYKRYISSKYYNENKRTVYMTPQLCFSNIYKCDFTEEDFRLYLDRLFSWYSLYPLTVSAVIRQDVSVWFTPENWDRLLNYLPTWKEKISQKEKQIWADLSLLNKFLDVFEYIKGINDVINSIKKENKNDGDNCQSA
jgi:hypothetical protein